MKQTIATALLSLMILTAVLAGCQNGLSGNKPAISSNGDGQGDKGNTFIPEDISESNLSDLPEAEQAEIKQLYGCYWMDGLYDNCIKIGKEELASYSTSMSFSYRNLRWSKLQDSVWMCCSYYWNDEDYDTNDRKIILKFTQDSGGSVKLWQYVVPMKLKSGPFTKGKEVESIVKDGKTFYVYDKTDPDSPEMGEPKKL